MWQSGMKHASEKSVSHKLNNKVKIEYCRRLGIDPKQMPDFQGIRKPLAFASRYLAQSE